MNPNLSQFITFAKKTIEDPLNSAILTHVPEGLTHPVRGYVFKCTWAMQPSPAENCNGNQILMPCQEEALQTIIVGYKNGLCMGFLLEHRAGEESIEETPLQFCGFNQALKYLQARDGESLKRLGKEEYNKNVEVVTILTLAAGPEHIPDHYSNVTVLHLCPEKNHPA